VIGPPVSPSEVLEPPAGPRKVWTMSRTRWAESAVGIRWSRCWARWGQHRRGLAGRPTRWV